MTASLFSALHCQPSMVEAAKRRARPSRTVQSVSDSRLIAGCSPTLVGGVRKGNPVQDRLKRLLGKEIRPRTGKRNRIRHRLFSFISRNWGGKPLYSLATIISLIGSTATKTGLIVYCDPDTNDYPTGIKISQSEMDTLDIRRDDFHGDWIYTFLPAPGRASVLCDKP